MARALRLDAPHSWHHVMNRGSGRRTVFRADNERELFLELVAELEARFGVEVHAYCLMGNHFHLLVHSRRGCLSDAMAWLGSGFTRGVNAHRCVDGPIFRGRFHSRMVVDERHLDWLHAYVNANPLDLGWTRPLAEYRWSGLGCFDGGVAPSWLRTEYIEERFGPDPAAYVRFVERAASRLSDVPTRTRASAEDIREAVELARAPGPIVNTDAEVRAVRSVLELRSGVDLTDLSTVRHLTAKRAAAYVARADDRVSRGGATRALAGRAASALAVGRNGCLTPDGTGSVAGHV